MKLIHIVNQYEMNTFPRDLFGFEKKLHDSLGKDMCDVSAMHPPDKQNFRLTVAIKQVLKHSKKIRKSLEIVDNIIKINDDFDKGNLEKTNQGRNEFRSKLVTFLLRYIFGSDKRYYLEYSYLNTSFMPIFIGRGSVKIANSIQNYINKIDKSETVIDKNTRHELYSTLKKVKELDYRGLIIAYIGSTKIFKSGSTTSDCEFDGLVFLPTEHKSTFLYVVEAKNKPIGNKEAREQLDCRLNKFLTNSLTYNLKKLGPKAAYAAVSLKE